MVGISDVSLKRVRGDQWKFKVRYQDAVGAAINLDGYSLACTVEWPDGEVEMTYDQVDLINGTFRGLVEPVSNAGVPEGRTAKAFIRVIDPDENPETLAIVPLLVID